MLLELKIADFALVDTLELEFAPGLNVLTGETGAGKSIIIDAVSAVLGGRVLSTDVRQGSERALVEAAFDTSSLDLSRVAAELPGDLDLLSDGVLIVSREIASEGRSKCRINARMANASHLAQLGRALVDIHGQHDHQSLLNPAKHVELLDAMGGAALTGAAAALRRLVARRSEIRAELQELERRDRDRLQREDLLAYQIREIEEARLEPGEEERLQAERLRLGHAERVARAVHDAYRCLYGGDDAGAGASAVESLGRAKASLEAAAAYDETLAPLVGVLQEALAAAEDAALDLRRYGEDLAADPARLSEVEARLERISRLKRKYGDTVEEILAYAESARSELESLSSSQERMAALAKELERVETELAGAAERLSAMRHETARDVEARIEERLRRLEMPDAEFRIAFEREEDSDGIVVGGTRVRVGERGIDRVEFLFSANRGESPRPLARIASGGEMSRVMLAIKGALAEIDPVGTLIFDEIDAGIGGRAANRVAEALGELAKTRQVLVVTHLAPIAAYADRHFAVEKKVEGDRTAVSVRALEGEERVWELARMLDGEATASSFAHAEALLELARPGRSAS